MIADAVVLGGGSSKGLADDAASKGAVNLNGKPMAEYVIDALRACPEVGRICLVIPSLARGDWADKADLVVESDDKLTDNVVAGCSSLDTDRMVLVLSSDIPLLTPEALTDFLERCAEEDARLFYPIIPETSAKALFPEMQRTYVKTRDGRFTGGNLMLVDPSIVIDNRAVMEEAYSLRKSPFKLAKRLGFRFIIGVLSGTLSISEAEKRVADILKSPVQAVVTPFAEIGLDVDKASDLEIIGSYFEGISRPAAN
ncbi:MAG: nucleotidyltransferase family protein [Candidatus Aquicultorales bacterium]